MQHLFRYALCLAVSLAPILLHAQETTEPQTGDAFRLVTPNGLKESNEDGEAVRDTINRAIPAGSRFNLVKVTTDNYVIAFWDWKEYYLKKSGDTSWLWQRYKLNYDSTKSPYARRFFLIPKGDFVGNAKRIYRRWQPTIGVLTYPFKYRPQSGRFEKTFSLAVTGGYQVLFSKTDPHHSFGFTLGAGPSSVTLARDEVRDTTEIGDGDQAAATLSFNLVYIHDRLQVAATVGLDKLIDGNNAGWKREGQPWFAIGIGANIFSADKSSKQTEGTQP